MSNFLGDLLLCRQCLMIASSNLDNILTLLIVLRENAVSETTIWELLVHLHYSVLIQTISIF